MVHDDAVPFGSLHLEQASACQSLPQMAEFEGCSQSVVAVAESSGFFISLFSRQLLHSILQGSEE